jgi:hypothetical protein
MHFSAADSRDTNVQRQAVHNLASQSQDDNMTQMLYRVSKSMLDYQEDKMPDMQWPSCGQYNPYEYLFFEQDWARS